MELENIAVSELVPFAKNSRTHDDAQVAQIAASIREFGFTNPVLIDEVNGIIAGHGRVMAARKLKLTEVPCIRLSHLSESQKRAYVIADNKLALNAGWDNAMLKLELADLKALDFDLDLTGFNTDEIDALLANEGTEGLTDPDDTPEPPVEPVTRLGDVWVCGQHRVMCGDSTNVTDFDKLCVEKADLIFTDPPYGMSYGGGRAAGSTPKGALVKAHGMILNDDLAGDDLITLIQNAITTSALKCKEGAALYACFTWRTYAEFEQALLKAGYKVKACIVWDKKSIGLGNSHYRPQHEFIFYCGGQWHGDKSQADVWQLSRGNTAKYVHPTQKPVELIEKALFNSSKKGDVIIDCFGGSGSTLIACEKNARIARLMELDPKYVDVIVKRWENFTGKKAVLESTGEQFKAAA
jgi:DNA modification methylase